MSEEKKIPDQELNLDPLEQVAGGQHLHQQHVKVDDPVQLPILEFLLNQLGVFRRMFNGFAEKLFAEELVFVTFIQGIYSAFIPFGFLELFHILIKHHHRLIVVVNPMRVLLT